MLALYLMVEVAMRDVVPALDVRTKIQLSAAKTVLGLRCTARSALSKIIAISRYTL
jgi:hypothetical protein